MLLTRTISPQTLIKKTQDPELEILLNSSSSRPSPSAIILGSSSSGHVAWQLLLQSIYKHLLNTYHVTVPSATKRGKKIQSLPSRSLYSNGAVAMVDSEEKVRHQRPWHCQMVQHQKLL